MSDYIPLVYVDIITYPCPQLNYGLANLYQLRSHPMWFAKTDTSWGKVDIISTTGLIFERETSKCTGSLELCHFYPDTLWNSHITLHHIFMWWPSCSFFWYGRRNWYHKWPCWALIWASTFAYLFSEYIYAFDIVIVTGRAITGTDNHYDRIVFVHTRKGGFKRKKFGTNKICDVRLVFQTYVSFLSSFSRTSLLLSSISGL